MKYLVLGAILYFVYKFMFQPSLSEGKKAVDDREEGDVEIRREDTDPRGDFIDYEEVE